MRDENKIKQRLAEIEYKLLKCNSLLEIWKLKEEHAELSRLLKRIIRTAQS